MNKKNERAHQAEADAIAKTIRTGQGLRDVLFDEIDHLRDGSGNPTRAIAVAKLACQIINVVKVEVEYQRHLRSINPGGEGVATTMETVALGTLA
jgi:hypothetical protein